MMEQSNSGPGPTSTQMDVLAVIKRRRRPACQSDTVMQLFH